MTTSEIEAWLKSTYPDKDFTVSESLGIGLPMIDKVMLYVRTDGPTPLKQLAEQLIAMTTGEQIP